MRGQTGNYILHHFWCRDILSLREWIQHIEELEVDRFLLYGLLNRFRLVGTSARLISIYVLYFAQCTGTFTNLRTLTRFDTRAKVIGNDSDRISFSIISHITLQFEKSFHGKL